MRGGSPIEFPTETVKAADYLPDLDKYAGPPLEFGRMEATASDPQVQQQYGMIVGIPNAGQVNALATLNIRGERSVTCKGDFDRHPVGRPPAAGRAAHVRGLSPLPRRHRARGGARRRVRRRPRPRENCRCTASRSPSRTPSTRRTCAPPAGATRPTISIFPRATTSSSNSSGTRAPSSSPRP